MHEVVELLEDVDHGIERAVGEEVTHSLRVHVVVLDEEAQQQRHVRRHATVFQLLARLVQGFAELFFTFGRVGDEFHVHTQA